MAFGEAYWIIEKAWEKAGWVVITKKKYNAVGEVISEEFKRRPGFALQMGMKGKAQLAPSTTDKDDKARTRFKEWELFRYKATDIDWAPDPKNRPHEDAVIVLSRMHPVNPEYYEERTGAFKPGNAAFVAAVKKYLTSVRGRSG